MVSVYTCAVSLKCNELTYHLDQGFEAGVNLKPYLGGTISATASKQITDIKIKDDVLIYFPERGLQAGVDVGDDAGVNIASGGKLTNSSTLDTSFNIHRQLNKRQLGVEVCAKPRAGVSLNVDVAHADTPEDPIVEKTITVRPN